MKNKIVIWDLFGGSNQSVYQAFKDNEEVEVHTFDINFNPKIKNPNTHVFDLTNITWFDYLVKTNKLPLPDLIFASPCCKSFSSLLHVGKGIKERLGIKYDEEMQRYRVRDLPDIQRLIESNNFYKHLDKDKIGITAAIGLELLHNTLLIIDKYNPKGWYIENPQKSLIWDVIEKNHSWFYNKGFTCKNLAYYYCYGDEFSKKPTYFYSNEILDLRNWLKDTKVKYNKGDRLPFSSGKFSKRSMIPKDLILNIFATFKKKVL